MAHEWIDRGLQQLREREERLRLAAEHRLHQAAVIKAKAPAVMGRLVAEVARAVDEYKQRAPRGSSDVEFEELPHEGFTVARTRFPRVSLECRPGYETHALYCNMTRTDDHESAPQELVFTVGMTADESDAIVLHHEARAFKNLDDVLEFLLTPVLFPTLGLEG